MAATILFRDVAREWWERFMLRGDEGYAVEAWRRLEREVLPALGAKTLEAINAPMILALRCMGYSGKVMTAHGFRALAATNLSEQGWPSEVIERQLAHVDNNRVRAAYQRSEFLAERRRMMQAWADWLDMRCAGAILGR